MTTAWPKQTRVGTADEAVSGATTLVPVVVVDDPGAAGQAGADYLETPPAGRRGRRRRPSARPAHLRRRRRPAALLALMVLPLAVALTVAAMTLLLPAPQPSRSATDATVLTGVTVEVVDAGAGVDLLSLVAARLTDAGAEVVTGGRATGSAGERTEIVYRDPAARAKAAGVRRALRAGSVVFDRSLPTSMEVTIVVGRDVRDS